MRCSTAIAPGATSSSNTSSPAACCPARKPSARARKAGLAVGDPFRFGRDYAATLKRWRADFMAALPAVRALGFDERFVRLWEFYLAYCEGAFNAGSTDVIQFELTRLADAT